MPRFTIDLSQRALARLQIQVQRTNENQGSDLTLQQWLDLHLREIAIQEELAAAVEQLREQHDRDSRDALAAAITAAREGLLAELEEGTGT